MAVSMVITNVKTIVNSTIYLILIHLINIFFHWMYVKFQLRLPR